MRWLSAPSARMRPWENPFAVDAIEQVAVGRSERERDRLVDLPAKALMGLDREHPLASPNELAGDAASAGRH